MKRATPLLALFLAISTPVSVIAQPRVISDLTQGALLGQIRDTAQLQNDFAQNRELLAQASQALGLSRSDFEEVRSDVAQGRARYVEIPRHLTGMAGSHNGSAFAVHDVVIPPHVYGWEVDLARTQGTVRVFVPNRCGNMSYLIVPRTRAVAVAAPVHRVVPAPQTVAVADIPPATAFDAPQAAPSPKPVAVAPIAPAVAAPAAHHFAILPWLALGLIGIAFMHGGGGNSFAPSTTSVPAAVPTPIPVHTICPPAVVH